MTHSQHLVRLFQRRCADVRVIPAGQWSTHVGTLAEDRSDLHVLTSGAPLLAPLHTPAAQLRLSAIAALVAHADARSALLGLGTGALAIAEIVAPGAVRPLPTPHAGLVVVEPAATGPVGAFAAAALRHEHLDASFAAVARVGVLSRSHPIAAAPTQPQPEPHIEAYRFGSRIVAARYSPELPVDAVAAALVAHRRPLEREGVDVRAALDDLATQRPLANGSLVDDLLAHFADEQPPSLSSSLGSPRERGLAAPA
ncbi:hypothetical protein [Nocardioides sp. Leaf285]|uniref:hypothetical protein n=1 Tax=Nocardioides sp. Leaf285 TaxID=1736322 RepID=UPI0012EAE391|nr:hypothetical protein [Nocardioides sp. Leaf285]